MSVTQIPGKDAPLETSIARMQATLAAAGFQVEESAWLNPVAGVWSVHLRDRDCPLIYVNGKGGSQLAARASALGEFFERLCCNYFWSHYYWGARAGAAGFVHYPQERWFPLGDGEAWPADLLDENLQAFYNPRGNIPARALVDFNSGNAARGICALPFQRQRDGATLHFPINVIANLYVSNGMSAGNSPAEAQTQALSEIFERYVKFKVIAEGLCLPEVPEEVIARYPRIAAGIAGLRAAGFGILVKDASLGGQFPVMNVTLLHPGDRGCYASFGAHPRFEVALERALTELLQGRALDGLAGFPEPGFDLEEAASAPNLEIHFVDSSGVLHWNFLRQAADFLFHDWNFGGASSTGERDWLVQRVQELGHDVYLAEFGHLGVYVCRILVPGLSEIYPVDDLEWENTSVITDLRAPILALDGLEDEACGDLLDALIDRGIADDRPVAALLGLAPDEGYWKSLRVGELKTQLALACGDREGILEGCQWARYFEEIDPERRRLYACVESLVKLEDLGDGADVAEAFGLPLTQLYGPAVVAQAQALLDGEQRFPGFIPLGADLEASDLHRRLMAGYARLQASRAPR